MDLLFNTENVFEYRTTETGSGYYALTLKEEEVDEVENNAFSEYLFPHQNLSGLLLYNDENNYLYLLRNDSGKIVGKGKGRIEISSAYFFPLALKSSIRKSNRRFIEKYADEFWRYHVNEKIKQVEQTKLLYVPMSKEIEKLNIDIFNSISRDVNALAEVLSKNSNIDELIKTKIEIQRLLSISHIHLDLCKKIKQTVDELKVIYQEI